MGVPRGVARLLLDEAARRPFYGSLLQLGRSTIYVQEAELRQWAKAQGARLRDGVAIELSHEPLLAAQGCLSDRSFFELLGFDEVRSLDYSDWEGADLLHDLNLPLPDELAGRFDTVFEAGTIQHIFDLPATLSNLHRLLRPEGRIVHGMATSSNHVDHGFYMFSPTLLHDYYTANRYRLDAEYFFEFTAVWIRGRFHSLPWRIYRYEPGCIDHLSYGGFGRRQVGLFFVAARTAESTAGVVPQQSWFVRFWREGVEAHPRMSNRRARWRERVEDRLVRNAVTRRLLFLWKLLRSAVVSRLPLRMPPVAHRY